MKENNLFLNALLCITILMFLPSCKEKKLTEKDIFMSQKKTRTSYLIAEKDKSLTSPVVRKIIEEKRPQAAKNGDSLVNQLKTVEISAQKELEKLETISNQIDAQIQHKKENISSKKMKKMALAKEQYEKIKQRLQRELEEKMRSIERSSEAEIAAAEYERRKKEVELVDSEKQKVLEKISQAELHLLSDYIDKKREIVDIKDVPKDIAHWKIAKEDEVAEIIEYLSEIFQDDSEIQHMLSNKKDIIEKNISESITLYDIPYLTATEELKHLTLLKKAIEVADKIMTSAFFVVQVPEYSQEEIKMDVQAELPILISQTTLKNEKGKPAATVSPKQIRSLVVKVIEKHMDEPIPVTLIKKIEAHEAATGATELDLVKEELSEETKEKIKLKMSVEQALQKVSPSTKEDVTTKKLRELQSKIGEITQQLNDQIREQKRLRKLLEEHQGKLEESESMHEEREQHVEKLKKDLHKTMVGRFHAEVEASKIAQMEEKIDNLSATIEDYENKNKETMELLSDAKEKIRNLEE